MTARPRIGKKPEGDIEYISQLKALGFNSSRFELEVSLDVKTIHGQYGNSCTRHWYATRRSRVLTLKKFLEVVRVTLEGTPDGAAPGMVACAECLKGNHFEVDGIGSLSALVESARAFLSALDAAEESLRSDVGVIAFDRAVRLMGDCATEFTGEHMHLGPTLRRRMEVIGTAHRQRIRSGSAREELARRAAELVFPRLGEDAVLDPAAAEALDDLTDQQRTIAVASTRWVVMPANFNTHTYFIAPGSGLSRDLSGLLRHAFAHGPLLMVPWVVHRVLSTAHGSVEGSVALDAPLSERELETLQVLYTPGTTLSLEDAVMSARQLV